MYPIYENGEPLEVKGRTYGEDKSEQPDGIDATDSAAKLAEEHGIDLATVKGTGTDGRIHQGRRRGPASRRRAAPTTPRRTPKWPSPPTRSRSASRTW